MDKSRGLFLVLDGLVKTAEPLERPRMVLGLESALRDFQALGWRIIGIGIERPRIITELPFEFDARTLQEDAASWEFPAFAWSVARRLSLNVRRSLLVSLDHGHEGWARDAGLKRFETPATLWGLHPLPGR